MPSNISTVHRGFMSKSGTPPFAPDQQAERVDLYELGGTVLVRWWNEGRTEVLSEMYFDRKEAWVVGALLQVVGRERRE